MRIAYVITRADSVGGATIHVRDLAREMRARGHDAIVLVGGTGPVTEQLKGAGVPFRSLRHLQRAIHPVRDCRAFNELAAVLRELRPDLVSSHTAKAGWIARAVCARLGLPNIYTPHGWTVSDRISPSRGFLFGLAEKTAAAWTNAIVCVSETERNLALARGIATPDRLTVIHNGVREIDAQLRARPETEPVRLVSVARFESPKDHRTLIAALACLRDKPWGLDLVGEGPLDRDTRDAAARAGIGERIRFLGYQPDPAPALAGGSIFVLSSRYEGFPRSVLEAMRAGLPVIASRVGGVAEAIEDGISGLLVARGDAEALAAALNRLIGDGLLRKRMGEAAHQTYQMRYRLEVMVERTAALYDAVLGRKADNGTIG